MNVEAGAREDAAASRSGSRGACIGSSADKWCAQSRPSQSKQHSGLLCQDAGGRHEEEEMPKYGCNGRESSLDEAEDSMCMSVPAAT